MQGAFAFEPSGVRGVELDRQVRHSAAESFSTLAGAIGAERRDLGQRLHLIGDKVAARPTRPALFALYSDLVQSIFLDDPTFFLSTAEALTQFDFGAPAPLRGVTLDDGDLGAGMAHRFLRHLDDDSTVPIRVAAISQDALESASRRLGETFALLDLAAPELAGEIRALVRDVVFVESRPGPDALLFHGASTFYLWGALFLNAQAHPDRTSMAVGLAHEAAHGLLLGSTLGAPMVENDAAERFASPLRDDPRPMDGIVHATYVLARMHYCIERLLETDVLTPVERDGLEAAKQSRRAEYFQGLEVVRAHARFTPVGRELVAAAETYMAAATGCGSAIALASTGDLDARLAFPSGVSTSRAAQIGSCGNCRSRPK